MELGLKLPFLHAYFPTWHAQLLAALTGPTSCDGFLNLVKLIEAHVAAPHLPWSRAAFSRIDCNSTWYEGFILLFLLI